MLMDIPGIGAQLARHISSWRSIVNPYRELELADKAGATVTTVFDASYPAALRELDVYKRQSRRRCRPS